MLGMGRCGVKEKRKSGREERAKAGQRGGTTTQARKEGHAQAHAHAHA